MRYLLIILGLLSFIVSDTIEYKDSRGKNKVVKNIKITEINDLEVHYQKSLGFLGNQTIIIDTFLIKSQQQLEKCLKQIIFRCNLFPAIKLLFIKFFTN